MSSEQRNRPHNSAGESSEPANLFLRILDGPQMGTRVPLRDGVTIGRKDGDLILQDPKLSVRHAQIQWRERDWVLKDLGSSNKIKVEGKRFDEITLYPGLTFKLGSTSIEVHGHPHAEDLADPESSADAPTRAAAELSEAAIQVSAEPVKWNDVLIDLLNRAKASPKATADQPPESATRPLPKMLRLEFTSGPQYGTVWTIGYGPRAVGGDQFDLGLIDPAAQLPDGSPCFIVDSIEGRVAIAAPAGSPVKISGKNIDTEPVELHSGDRLEIGKTRIRVILE